MHSDLEGVSGVYKYIVYSIGYVSFMFGIRIEIRILSYFVSYKLNYINKYVIKYQKDGTNPKEI